MASVVAAPAPSLGSMARLQDLILPVGIISSVLVIMIPLPPALMDVLLSSNITVAVLVLLTTVFVRTPLEFNIFPSLLLATTLFRLVLNVATTRLILTHAGADGLWAAGGVVKAFGEFVAGDKIVVGLIIFAIIVVIQFVVITKGATRISEVAARFALDGMPGRQMAIDADLNAGTIDEREAQRRRLEITQQADFFGAMDGASKFVRGDAVAGIVITLINIVGGLFIGMIESNMTFTQAADIFTKLTIGDGLVTQVPAFLISLAAGLLVTRSSQDSDLPADFIKQLFSRPQALAVAGGFLGVLMFTHLPHIPLMVIGASCVGLALTITRREHRAAAAVKAKKQADAAKHPEERVEDFLSVDPMEVEIGVGLIRLADPKRGGDLLERIQRRPPERGRGHRRYFAQGTHPRQHATGTESIPHQDRRHGSGRRNRVSGHVSGHRLAHDDREDPRHGHQGPGLRHAGGVDRGRFARTGRDVRLHRGRAGQRYRHAFDRNGAEKRRRDSNPRRRKTPHRRIETHFARGGRRTDSRRYEVGRSAADPAIVAARVGAHPAVRADFGDPGRLCPAHERSRSY